MRKTIKGALFACAALASLAFAGSAFASYAPKLVVSSTDANGPARLGVVAAGADDPTAKVSIYVPAGYTVGSPAAGTKLGDVTATASAADLGGAVLPLTGELDAVPATATTQAAAQQCGVTPAQTWDLHLTAAGQTLDIPLFVVATAGPEASLGATKLVVCLPPPDVPVGTPGRATFGAKLLSATFSASAINEPKASADLRWTSLWTPYTPGKGTPNPAGSVEAQALRHLPVILHFNSARKRIVTHKTIRVNGKKKTVNVISTRVAWKANVTENGKPPADAVIGVVYKGKRIGGASGSFTFKGLKSVKLTVVGIVDSGTASIPTGQAATVEDLFYHDLGGSACTPSAIFGGLPCTDATVGGEILAGDVVVKAFLK
jgi:hypothetical protein